jgi:hypothetical protein
VIHYAPAPDAIAQVDELRTWLMVLAVDSARIRLMSDLPLGHPLEIEATP